MQWNRKYYEPGTFSLEIPLAQYNSSYKYIFTKDRTEMGEITQINFINQRGYKAINISGFFLENWLNKRVVYRKGTSNIVGGPEWMNQEGNAEDVAYAYFNSFKDVSISQSGDTVDCIIGIESGQSLSRGKISNHERCGEKLGSKIYSILKPSEMSYRILYDFEENKKVFSVWSGYDRTQDQSENNPVTFSTRYGNIKNPNILIETTNYCNSCIIDNENNGAVYERALLNKAAEDDEYIFSYVKSSVNKNDYNSDTDFYSALDAEGKTDLNERVKLINVEFDAMEGSYDYMEDFDLGDKCNIEIPEVDISADAVLIGCYEVIKKGNHSLTLEFGEPVLRR
ncbi:MAG: hypothetical protein SO267_12455 [Lachnospiraceae bacterium]|nr:hypothetical protein [Lachnospiraceae bacterium]